MTPTIVVGPGVTALPVAPQIPALGWVGSALRSQLAYRLTVAVLMLAAVVLLVMAEVLPRFNATPAALDASSSPSAAATAVASPTATLSPTATPSPTASARASKPVASVRPSPARSSAPSAGPSGSLRSYVVQSGDTLSSIARRFGTTIAALKAANGLGDSDTIYAGRTILIP